MLRVTGQSHELTRLWEAALSGVIVRHPNCFSVPVLTLVDAPEPVLRLELDATSDSRDPVVTMRRFIISSITLTYFPGVTLARQWLAAAWAGYVSHEALELVTVDGLRERPLDPHEQPYPTNPWNRGLRDGMPTHLTPETLVAALSVVMDHAAAQGLVANG